MEYTGTIIKAGVEQAKTGKDVFKVAIRSEGRDWEFTLFDQELIDLACENFEGNVKYTVEKKGNFWNLVSLEPASESDVSKVTFENGEREIRIIRQAMVKGACVLHSGKPIDLDEVVATADFFVAYILSPIPKY